MHAAGERTVGLDGGDAVVTAAGRAAATDTVVRAAGIAAIAITTATEVLAAWREDLGLAAVALSHRGGCSHSCSLVQLRHCSSYCTMIDNRCIMASSSDAPGRT